MMSATQKSDGEYVVVCDNFRDSANCRTALF